MKNTHFSMVEGSASALCLRRAKSGVIKCTNLRQAADGGLECASDPANITKKLLFPLTMLQIFNGKTLIFFADGATIYTANLDQCDVLTCTAVLNANVVAAIPLSDNCVTIFTDDGETCQLRYNSDTNSWDLPPDLPPVVIRADDHAELSASVEAFTLCGSYPHCNEAVSDSDRATVSKMLSAAVDTISDAAAVAGRYIFPRLFAYRLLDTDGRLLFRSTPVWVGQEEGGFGLCEMLNASVTRSSSGVCNVEAFSVAATAFKAVIDVPRGIDGTHARDVALLEVLASPPIVPYDPNAVAGCRLRAVNQSTGCFDAYIPGTSIGMSPCSDQRADAVARVLERFWCDAVVVDKVAYPFAGGFNADTGARYAIRRAVADKIYRVSEPLVVSSSDLSQADRMLSDWSAPSFSPRAVVSAGDINVYADISRRRQPPPHASILAASEMSPQSVSASHFVAVDFSDGSDECAVTIDNDASAIPVAIGPVVIYPDPDAASLSVGTRSADGQVSSLSLKLKRSLSGGFAYYIDPDLKPVPLVDDTVWKPPVDNRRPHKLHGVVAVARSGDPLAPIAATTASTALIHRILPAVRSASSLDFARQHMLLFADDGICSLSVNAARNSLSVNKIHPVGVARTDAVAATPDAIYAALSDGALVRIVGSRVYSVDPTAEAMCIGWCAARNELWTTAADGSTRVIATDSATAFNRSFSGITAYSSVGGAAYAMTVDGLFDLARERSDIPVEVEWMMRIPVDRRAVPRAMAVDMQCAEADVAVALRADDGAGCDHALPLVELRLKGAVNSPVMARVVAPHRRWISICIKGSVSPDATVSHYNIDMS